MTRPLLEVGMHWFPRAGGTDRYFNGLVQAFERASVPFHAIAFGEENSSNGKRPQFECLGPRNANALRRFSRIRASAKRVLREQNGATVVATHFALYAAPLLDIFPRNSHVVHFHGPWCDESAVEGQSAAVVFFKRQLELTVYRTASRFIVLSEAFANLLVERFHIPEEKISIIPGAIDSAAFHVDASREQAREHLGWPQDRRIIVCVRRLTQRMGLTMLIDAIDKVRRRFPEVLLLIAGKGRMHDELAAMIKTSGLDNYVKLLGYVADDQLPWAYRGADLSIVPSQALEGFGLVTLESLAAGTPVMVTPVGGLCDAVQGLSANLVLQGCSSEDLALGLSGYLDGTIHLPSEERCRDYVRLGFDWSVIAPRVLEVYQSA